MVSPWNIDPGRAVLRVVEHLGVLLKQPEFSNVNDKLVAAHSALAGAQQNLDRIGKPLPCTVDDVYEVPLRYIASTCGTIWITRPHEYFDPTTRKTKVQHLRSGAQVKNVARLAKQNPTFAAASATMQRPFLAPGEQPIDSAEWWTTLWVGPELSEIDGNADLRAQFWKTFVETCWQTFADQRQLDLSKFVAART